MKIIADLHIHSRYSRAVSDKMVLPEIARWASLKGINLVGTGDFTHPLWFREIVANLKEISDGIFSLKQNVLKNSARAGNFKNTLFILQQEISSVYSQGGQGRRIHNLVYAPSIKTVERINEELTKRGCNLMSDGRPIIGLSSIELCELVFGIDGRCLIVPAHIWTPYFSLYGSKSGFDSIEECFGKYAKYIYGIETGLSSDCAMNWRIKELDERAILSSSDAHSGPKLGREVTVFNLNEKSYKAIREAIMEKCEVRSGKWEPPAGGEVGSRIDESLKSRNQNISLRKSRVSHFSHHTSTNRIAGTIEFYPEEGKYHYTGHRNCKVRYSPEETRRKGTTCPACGNSLTVGVMHRVEELAKYSRSGLKISKGPILKKRVDKYGVQWIFHPQNRKPPFTMLVPLLEIICEVFGGSIYTQTTKNEYNKLTLSLGNEFYILLKAPLEDIERVSGKKMADAIQKVRSGEIKVLPGYDGEFGTVKIFSGEEKSDPVSQQEQLGMF